jgi:UTP--glucose-1-phosphate uridylyltransferase
MEGTGRATQRRVRIAVFPVAGFAENFLPATKACPKEMLPIVDRPLIQYAVEEAAAAGLTRMVLVTGRGKRAIEDHFDHAYELERELMARSNDAALTDLRSAVPAGVTFSYVHQPGASGLADAIARARPIVGEEPFAVVLPDHLIDGERPALAQLLDVFAEQQVSVVGAQRVASESRAVAGLIGADLGDSAVRSARALVNVPPIGAVSTALAAAGRYVFTAAVWKALERVDDNDDGALSHAIRRLMERERVFACLIEGRRFDCGSKLGFLEAQLAFARKRDELWPALVRDLRALVAEHPEAGERSVPRAALTSNANPRTDEQRAHGSAEPHQRPTRIGGRAFEA